MITTTRSVLLGIRLPIVLITVILSGCGGGNLNDINKEEADIDNIGTYSGKVNIDMVNKPTISYSEADGITNIVLQFIPRTEKSLPLSPEQIEVEIKINDEPINVEDKLSSTAKELAYSVHYALVLDASYSMVDSQSFEPMLKAAQKSVQTGLDIWGSRPGEFTFQTSWFDSYIYHSINNQNLDWSPQDIAAIPSPVSGARTKLYAAIDFMLDELLKKQNNKENSDDKFQNIMLVFSDGEDNYSYFDNSDFSETNSVSSGVEYVKSGRVETTLATVLNKIKSIENLTIHVIGLGDKIDEENLSTIANTGNGLYLPNPQTDKIVNLFDRVTSEFTTLQSHGVNASLDQGEYKFSLLVKSKADDTTTEYSFDFKTGDATAAIIEKE